MPATFSLDPVDSGPGVGRRHGSRRRDRRGTAGRGALLPPGLPGALTRQERFEDLVADSAERLQDRWTRKLANVSFEVAVVPDEKSLQRATARGEAPPLGACTPGRRSSPATVVVFRRPCEEVAGSPKALPWLVHDVVVELVSELLAMPPEELDPGYRGMLPPDEP